MEKFIPKTKMSKKAQKALNASVRGSWGDIRPVTTRIESKKRDINSPRKRKHKGGWDE